MDSINTVPQLRNQPKQARATKRLEKIHDAGYSVIAKVGRDRFTTADVAAAAGCSIGTFYRYYPDRVALLDVLYPKRTEGLGLPASAAAEFHVDTTN